MDDSRICIYHDKCADGMGALLAVLHAHEFDGKTEVYPGAYGNPPPDVTDREVIIVDFSYKRNVLLEMAAKAKSILLLDHHKSAREDLSGEFPDNVTIIFDMNKSGARIAWDYYHQEDAPKVLKYIEDRDLWRFIYPQTRAVMASLFSHPYDVDVWKKLVFDSDVDDLYNEGVGMLRDHTKRVNELVDTLAYETEIDGVSVWVCNCPWFFASDVGGELANRDPVLFAATYCHDGSEYRFSLRSTKSGMDVSDIAKKFGGGGHVNAAGFSVATLEEIADIQPE